MLLSLEPDLALSATAITAPARNIDFVLVIFINSPSLAEMDQIHLRRRCYFLRYSAVSHQVQPGSVHNS
jgi:hypothetical protein